MAPDSGNENLLVEKDKIRLECLKLVFRRDFDPSQNIEAAEIYLRWVSKNSSEPVKPITQGNKKV